ncbi:hypothetical protein [Alicyclobacillus fastidiosus]|uniref:hypothetical protein n=1 Tax=Alicyclobacillus fastidiosus TaxID=392011 RepID=UPI0024E19630|nr:hypothetical protein [Alicyclobacillus fastidiosus]
MIIRIAAFSSKEFMPRILKYQGKIQDVEIVPYVYEHPSESVALLDTVFDCNVLFFAGLLPYHYAKEKIKEHHLPAVHIESYEYKLTTTLLHIKLQRDDLFNHLSIDLPEAEYVATKFGRNLILAMFTGLLRTISRWSVIMTDSIWTRSLSFIGGTSPKKDEICAHEYRFCL